MRIYIKIKYISLVICFFLAVSVVAQETDEFAKIGNKRQGARLHLLEDKLPPVLPEVYLPNMKSKKSAFQPIDKMDSKAELEAELKHMRAKFMPFMKNYAPKTTKTRERIYLKEFNWRVETKEDEANFTSVLHGNGQWENVKVPHYGPPENRVTTYYRKTFTLNEEVYNYKNQFLHFKGVDYRAKVFLNGAFVGSHEGFFAPFEFNITPYLKRGENTLLVQVENDFPAQGGRDSEGTRKFGNKIYASTGLGWDDPNSGWHHCPPGMGIYQDCYIEGRDPIHLNDVFVRPLVEKEAVEIWFEVNNYYEDFRYITMNLSIYGQNFEEVVLKDFKYIPSTTYIPGLGDLAKPQDWQESNLYMGYGVNFLKVEIPIKSPRLWNNDTPYLYQLQTKVLDENGMLTDMKATTFGMRSFTQDTVSIPKGQMYLNGEKIKLRGANTMGYMQQDVKNKDWDQLIDDILLAKVCNMNFLRLTQRPVQPEIYEYANQLGMMLQTDLPLFGALRPNLFAEGVKQAGEMERLVRNHPSNVIITYMNERFPNGEGHPQRSMSSAQDYERFYKACDQIVHHWNPDRVIKAGDGDYDPPSPGLPDNHLYNIWYNGQAMGLGELHKGYWQKVKPNWYFACGEFGSEALDNYSVIQKYWPKEWLPKNENDQWYPDKVVKAQSNRFHYMWYPTPVTVKDWVEASQNHQAWGTRLLTEAFRRDDRMVSFAIHLFIDAWPSGWMKAIMDVDRNPKKAFYVYRDALAPIMVSLRTDRYHFTEGEAISVEAWISNDLIEIPQNYTLKWQWEKAGKVLKSSQTAAQIKEHGSKFQGHIVTDAPKVNTRSQFQLRLALFDEAGKGVSESKIDLDIFPKNETDKNTNVFVASNDETILQILSDLDVKPSNNKSTSSTILVSNFEDYQENKSEYDKLVEQGARLIFLELPAGEHEVGDEKVTIENTIMGKYYFVNPVTGHPLVEDFKPFDFKFWYHEEKKLVRPLLESMVRVENDAWSTILKTGKTTWVDIKGEYAAAAELKKGKGAFIICQLQLANRLKTNPTARLFASRLLKK
ncbi:glycoside hydrolase family 2 TIM barrel-domain containing protein [Aureibaculum sp. 2210JD6-5]|uniref:glycoside hydrolase family 2 protein n=1 Tax=Aureibaculum sp. 2210JD6-5 TaxID=3103957 RepID=UPI002AAEEAD5|nr:sugar-binding domain-containing protein [Aureibaculum sp. 2210JD6-5]MDY7396893.1 glycoside hydrolase family 2 TIM barrel-domain containing protein [Aureibaculum sp. 2210JD6-5]